MKKKIYTKPTLVKLGNLESFVKGFNGSSGWIDIYSHTKCIGNPYRPGVIKVTCAEPPTDPLNLCNMDAASNYFVYTIEGPC